ncbi:sugar phosphate isomerase/epimerase [PVC group bacterium]|nr:sugar phosphate isomerase/epimerase [PVC group bacterium]
MNREISIQLYSVRDQAVKDYEGTIRAIADMGFTNVETAGFPGSSISNATQLFKDLGIKVPSAHGELPLGEEKNRIIEEALMLGNKYIITGCPPNFKEDYKNIDAVKRLAEIYCEAGQSANEYGIQVGYHNHDWDLIDVEGEPGYRCFLDNTPETVLWEADLFWVSRAGINPVDFVKEIGVRGAVLHFKDGIVDDTAEFTEAETDDGRIMISNSSPFLPAGVGEVDLLAVSEVAEYTQYAVVELDSYNGDMMKAVQESYTYLTESGIARGGK